MVTGLPRPFRTEKTFNDSDSNSTHPDHANPSATSVNAVYVELSLVQKSQSTLARKNFAE
jgi:hypothetical protein